MSLKAGSIKVPLGQMLVQTGMLAGAEVVVGAGDIEGSGEDAMKKTGPGSPNPNPTPGPPSTRRIPVASSPRMMLYGKQSKQFRANKHCAPSSTTNVSVMSSNWTE